jgi:hypothetical protein
VPGADLSALATAPAAGGRALRLSHSGTASFDTGADVTLADLGTINNDTPSSNVSIFLTGADNLIASGTVQWAGGSITGPLTAPPNRFVVNGTMSIDGSGLGLNHRILENNGTVTWHSGQIPMSNSALIQNNAGATFDITNDSPIVGAHINNAGLLVKSAGATTFGAMTDMNAAVVNNTGTIPCEAGTLNITTAFPPSGTNSGTFEVLAGADIRVADYVMDAASLVKGAGTMEFFSNTNSVAGTYNVTGRTNVIGGLEFKPGATLTNPGSLFDVDVQGNATFNTGSPSTTSSFAGGSPRDDPAVPRPLPDVGRPFPHRQLNPPFRVPPAQARRFPVGGGRIIHDLRQIALTILGNPASMPKSTSRISRSLSSLYVTNFLPWAMAIRASGNKQGEVFALRRSQIVERALQGWRVVALAVADGTVVALEISPTGKWANKCFADRRGLCRAGRIEGHERQKGKHADEGGPCAHAILLPAAGHCEIRRSAARRRFPQLAQLRALNCREVAPPRLTPVHSRNACRAGAGRVGDRLLVLTPGGIASFRTPCDSA